MWFMMSAANRARVDLLYFVKIIMSPGTLYMCCLTLGLVWETMGCREWYVGTCKLILRTDQIECVCPCSGPKGPVPRHTRIIPVCGF